jgi:protocatechuate 3,4-dioxygenase beta subunit
MHVIEPGRCTYYIDDLVFEDDPRLTPEVRRAHVSGRGGPGLVSPTPDGRGGFVVRRDIRLGERVPGYPAN